MKYIFKWLKISEYVALGTSIGGTIAAIVSNQIIYAAAPILFTIGLNIVNRQNFSKSKQLEKEPTISLNYKPNEVNPPITASSASPSASAIGELVEKLTQTIQFTAVHSNIGGKDLQKILIFISEVIDQVNQSLIDILPIVNAYEYMTIQDLKKGRFVYERFIDFDSYFYRDSFYKARNLCDKLHNIRESCNNYIESVLSKNMIDIEQWLSTFFELEGLRFKVIKLVVIFHHEISEYLQELNIIYSPTGHIEFTHVDQDALSKIDKDKLNQIVKDINNKAHAFHDFLENSIQKLFQLNNKILGQSGEVGFLELINDRSALKEEAKIFFTNIEDKSVSETFNSDLTGANVGNFVNKAQDNASVQSNQYNYTSEEKQNLSEVAGEIQKIFYQLSQNDSTAEVNTTDVIYQEIQSNPTLKNKLQAALKAGGLEALKAIFNHPVFSIPAETVKGWLEAK